MRLPVVNLNGTSREELTRQHHDTYKLLRETLDALMEATPHGRDYPNPQAYLEAREEHTQRVRALYAVFADIAALLEHLELGNQPFRAGAVSDKGLRYTRSEWGYPEEAQHAAQAYFKADHCARRAWYIHENGLLVDLKP